MSFTLLTILIMICSVLSGFFLLGVIIPISCTVGECISDKLESFLSRF